MLFDKDIMTVFSWDLLRLIASNESVSLSKLNLLLTMLIDRGIPFETSYNPGNRKTAPAIEVTIYMSPTAKLVVDIDLGPGGSAFTST